VAETDSGSEYDLERTPAEELLLLIRAGHGLILVETTEERRLGKAVIDMAKNDGRVCYAWSSMRGLMVVANEMRDHTERENTTQPVHALSQLLLAGEHWVAVLVDLHSRLKEPEVCRAVREAAEQARLNDSALILVSPAFDIPMELESLATRYEFALPDSTHLERVVRRVYKNAADANPKVSADLSREGMARIVGALAGLTEEQAERAVRQAILKDQRLHDADAESILEFKRSAAATLGKLERVATDEDLGSLGGLEELKRWLRQRRKSFSAKAQQFGLQSPKGVLLLGVPGTGKSLSARLIAGEWRRPLMKLDAGALYNKYIGATESNLRESLKQADAAAPCILWIDEIEKAFASAGADSIDGGVSQRVFGTMLGWMNDRKSEVFLVATANDVQRLPPELLRKGRFDEVFFVDLPNAAARHRIFEIHLEKRRRRTRDFAVDEMVIATAGFSGAEIEQAVVDGLYAAFEQNAPLATRHILQAIESTRPLSVVMAERIAVLRAWAAERCVFADRLDS